jgi:predicted HAD superfamily Cof-like phosphohydrolase
MIEQLEQLKEFHSVFGHPIEKSPCAQSDELAQLRYRLGKEELDEYLEANQNDDPVGIADALADQLYILLGTMLVHGMQDTIVTIFDEVHRSNMSKLGEDGKPIYREDGKVMKGPNYFKPNIDKIIHDAWKNGEGQMQIEFDEKV